MRGVDLNKTALEKGKQNVSKRNLDKLIHLTQSNAMKLPFEDQSFDIILNEAMLTMLPYQIKEKC